MARLAGRRRASAAPPAGQVAARDRRAEVRADRELAEKYRRLAPRYDLRRLVFDGLGLGKLRRRLASRAGGRTLEVAVGTGGNLPHYRRDAEITGVDLSPEMLSRAKNRSVRIGRKTAFARMSTEKLAFPDASFDTVIDSLALCTYADPVAALREMRRVCRPGGRILLLEHGRSHKPRLGRWQDRRDARKGEPGCRWSRDPVRLVRRAGLHPASVERRLLGVFQLIEARPPRDANSGDANPGPENPGDAGRDPHGGDHEDALHPERPSLR